MSMPFTLAPKLCHCFWLKLHRHSKSMTFFLFTCNPFARCFVSFCAYGFDVMQLVWIHFSVSHQRLARAQNSQPHLGSHSVLCALGMSGFHLLYCYLCVRKLDVGRCKVRLLDHCLLKCIYTEAYYLVKYSVYRMVTNSKLVLFIVIDVWVG